MTGWRKRQIMNAQKEETMNTQPEALRLADALDKYYEDRGPAEEKEAAAELRRLHEENEELVAQRDKLADILTRTANELKGKPDDLSRHSWHDLPDLAQRLHKANQELLEALQAAERAMSSTLYDSEVLAFDSVAHEMIRAAIRARGNT